MWIGLRVLSGGPPWPTVRGGTAVTTSAAINTGTSLPGPNGPMRSNSLYIVGLRSLRLIAMW